MKKLLFSFLAIGLVSIGAFAATRAYFSDQATILGNQITTGFLEIDLDGLGGSVYHNSMKFLKSLHLVFLQDGHHQVEGQEF